MAKQSLSLNREELAWAAGFFDGEGHSRRGDRRALGLTISQADGPELLYRFQRAVGVGTVRGPYTHTARPKQRPFYVYDALGYENVQHCLCMLWRWLGTVKRAQAKQSLALWLAKPRKFFKTTGTSRLICSKGHRVEGANAIVAKTGRTACRECRRAWGRRASAAKRATTP